MEWCATPCPSTTLRPYDGRQPGNKAWFSWGCGSSAGNFQACGRHHHHLVYFRFQIGLLATQVKQYCYRFVLHLNGRRVFPGPEKVIPLGAWLAAPDVWELAGAHCLLLATACCPVPQWPVRARVLAVIFEDAPDRGDKGDQECGPPGLEFVPSRWPANRGHIACADDADGGQIGPHSFPRGRCGVVVAYRRIVGCLGAHSLPSRARWRPASWAPPSATLRGPGRFHKVSCQPWARRVALFGRARGTMFASCCLCRRGGDAIRAGIC
jgi:hypothetical protein